MLLPLLLTFTLAADPTPAEKYRAIIAKEKNTPQAQAARYGLGRLLLDEPTPNFPEAIALLADAARNCPEEYKTYAEFYRGHALRLQALTLTNDAEIEANCENARQAFVTAYDRFRATLPMGETPPKPAPPAYDWAMRARCEQAEMLLRLGKPAEAKRLLDPLVKQPFWSASTVRPLALFRHGIAASRTGEWIAAGRSLAALAPYDQPGIGLEARYRMGRVYHNTGEPAEAKAMYDAVLAASNTPSEAVVGAHYYRAVLDEEAGAYPEAIERFTAFRRQHPASAFVPEAELRLQAARIRLKQTADAIQVLPAFAEKYPKLADQAYLWLGKAQEADPDRALQAYRIGVQKALAHRRPVLYREIADTFLRMGKPDDAIMPYMQVANEPTVAKRADEAIERVITAAMLAGKWSIVESWIERFNRDHPQSLLASTILLRHGEALELWANSEAKPNRERIAKAGSRYERFLDQFPDDDRTPYVRHRLANCRVATSDYDGAAKMIAMLPAGTADYLQAECLLRTLGDDPNDKLGIVCELLGKVVDGPELPDALLKLGVARMRLGKFADARTAFDRLAKDFPDSPQTLAAGMERGSCFAALGDMEAARKEWRRYVEPPYNIAPEGPTAVVLLAQSLRAENKAQESADLLDTFRKKTESLLSPKGRNEENTLLRMQHGLSLMMAGKLLEARLPFNQVMDSDSASMAVRTEAALHSYRCRVRELAEVRERARVQHAAAKTINERLDRTNRINETWHLQADAAQNLDNRLRDQGYSGDHRARLLAELAGYWRAIVWNEAANLQRKTPFADKLVLQTPHERLWQSTVERMQKNHADHPQTAGVVRDWAAWVVVRDTGDGANGLDAGFQLFHIPHTPNDFRILGDRLRTEHHWDEAIQAYELADDFAAPIRIGLCRFEQGRPGEAMEQFNKFATRAETIELWSAARYLTGIAALANNQPELARQAWQEIRGATRWQQFANEKLATLPKK